MDVALAAFVPVALPAFFILFSARQFQHVPRMTLGALRVVFHKFLQVVPLFKYKGTGVGVTVHVLDKAIHRFLNVLVLFTQFTLGDKLPALLLEVSGDLHQLALIRFKMFIHGLTINPKIGKIQDFHEPASNIRYG
jgi:hypothetical protein